MAKETKATTPVMDADAMMEMMKAKMEQMMAEAEKKAELRAEEIIKAAEAKAKGSKALPEEIQRINEINEEKVTIKLFKDGDKYNDDIFVSVNGQSYNIPRGIPVTIPRKIAATLEQSDLQDIKTAQYMDAKANEFSEETKRRKL